MSWGLRKIILVAFLFICTPAFAGELKIETLVEGDGFQADKNKKVTVHYEGRLESGTIFDA